MYILSLEYIINTSLCTSLVSLVSSLSDTCDTIAILDEVHNDVMMMYSKNKMHIEHMR